MLRTSDRRADAAALGMLWVGNPMAALTYMRASLRAFAKYVPQDVVRLLMSERREAVLGLDETEITVRRASLKHTTHFGGY